MNPAPFFEFCDEAAAERRRRVMRRTALPVLALLAFPLSAQTEDGRRAYAELVAAYELSVEAWQRDFNAAHRTKDAERHAAVERRRPARVFMERFAQEARRFAGTEDAVPFLVWMLRNGRRGVGDPAVALETLARDHARSPQLAEVGREVSLMVAVDRFPRPRAAQLLAEIAKHNEHDAVKIACSYHQAEILHEVAETDADRAAVAAAYRDVLACEPHDELTPRAERGLFELEHLQVGKVAPDIEGEDLDGVPFKLSDYRGKVVLLDFWGDW